VSWSQTKHRPVDGDREDGRINPADAERKKRFRDQYEAIFIDSPLASYSQRRIDEIRRSDPEGWKHFLEETARPPATAGLIAARVRVRALDLLCQFGPQPSDELLIALAADNDAVVRARAVGLLGQRSSQPIRDALEKALQDKDSFVRRHACEGLMQQPAETIPIARLLMLLDDPDRFIRFSARVAIEHGPIGDLVKMTSALAKPRPRLLVESLLAIVRASRLDERRQEDLLQTEIAILKTPLDPDLQADLLRLIELTYLLGPRKADAAGSARLRPILLGLFSTTVDTPANRETARLLAFLDEPRAVGLILEHQAIVPDLKAQIHDAYCLRAMKRGWTEESKQHLWSWYQKASEWEGGYSFRGYLDRMIAELIGLLDQPEKERYLAQGERFPFPTQVLVRAIHLDSGSPWVPALTSLYGRLRSNERAGMEADLRALIIEKLGRSARPEAQAALRALHHLDPRHRDAIARAGVAGQSSYTLPLLVDKVLSAGVMRTASSQRGQQVIERAKCLDCHKFGPKGEGLGPDLSTVSSRFRPVEILESIVEPSKVISDQYKPVSVATSDGKVYNGMPIVTDGPNLVLLLSDGTKVTIPKTDIDGRNESSVSVMPAGLINSLSYQEIADMLALFDSAPRVEAPALNKK